MAAGIRSYPADYLPMDPLNHSPTSRPLHGLDVLATESQYALQQMQDRTFHQRQHHQPQFDVQSGPSEARETLHNPRDPIAHHKPGKSVGGPVRRRISRACDQCNQMRTKCDGKFPCAHCVEFAMTCEYARERKKRGKASRKEIAAQQAAAAAAATATSGSVESATDADRASLSSSRSLPDAAAVASGSNETRGQDLKRKRTGSASQSRSAVPQTSHAANATSTLALDQDTFAIPSLPSVLNADQRPNQQQAVAPMMHTARAQPAINLGYQDGQLSASNIDSHNMASQRSLFSAVGDYSQMADYNRISFPQPASMHVQATLHNANAISGVAAHSTPYSHGLYAIPSPQSQAGGQIHQFRSGDSPASANALLGQFPHTGSPAWLDLPSPSPSAYANLQHHAQIQHQAQLQHSLRYPVLRSLLPRISSIIPVALACDLLERYFASSSTVFVQPASPYIVGFILRKRSVLRKTNYRTCSQALLASMLWVSAQTSESFFLTSPPSQRAEICHQLHQLTIELLKPLIHTTGDPAAQYGALHTINGVALGGFGVSKPASTHDTTGSSTGATGTVDDIITYINLATVVSASEYKAASMRWWVAACSLARELKLGRELPPNQPANPQQDHISQGASRESSMPQSGQNTPAHHQHQHQASYHPATLHVSEEEREERRRIWWMLYMLDRHLALAFNIPLFLLDVECDGLLQPENETVWQSGEHYPPENHEQTLYFRRRGPCFECTGHATFDYFLPLMTILGEIVDINQARNHPRFGLRNRTGHEWDDQIKEISDQLHAYGRSLKDFEARYIGPKEDEIRPRGELNQDSSAVQSNSTGATRMTETVLQTRKVLAYATHMMHTLHILLNGKWDPITLLDDNDLWISSESFISATGHAVSAAEAIGDILEYDPDLSFMPFFFGIYLLQGSFLLLLIADKLRADASPNVVKACETIVRAHEVCVVTLNTEYQRNFRNVMRSALAQVKGRLPGDAGEEQQRRREVLSLYRWTGDGNGLAL